MFAKKYFICTEIFCQIKQNYTKNEQFIQQSMVLGLLQRTLVFELHFGYNSIWLRLVFNSNVSNNCSIYA